MNLSFRLFCQLTVIASLLLAVHVSADFRNLQNRDTPRPQTTDGIPHIQIDVEPVPELSAELLQRVSQIESIELRRTVVGRSGSTGFWLSENVELAQPDAIIRGREFAHLHPDGSLHASLPPDVAVKAIEAGWAIHHPWASKKQGLEGFVMIYTPMSKDELDVVFSLVVESHRYVTGKEAT